MSPKFIAHFVVVLTVSVILIGCPPKLPKCEECGNRQPCQFRQEGLSVLIVPCPTSCKCSDLGELTITVGFKEDCIPPEGHDDCDCSALDCEECTVKKITATGVCTPTGGNDEDCEGDCEFIS
jgi:hypothetical protein